MKRLRKRVLSWLLALAMLVTGFYVPGEVQEVKAAETDVTVSIGAPVLHTDGNDVYYTFDNISFTGDGSNHILNVSLQFSSIATRDKDIIQIDSSSYGTGTGFEIVQKTINRNTHKIINAEHEDNPPTAEEWANYIKNNVKFYVSDDETIKKVAVSADATVKYSNDWNLIEYNSNNGHYYELVNVESGISWEEASNNSHNADNFATGQGTYESYLVTITSEAENAFVYTICDWSTWIATSCDEDYAFFTDGKVGYDQVKNNNGEYVDLSGLTIKNLVGTVSYDGGKSRNWIYTDGPEAGKIMTYGTTQYGNENTMVMRQEGYSEVNESTDILFLVLWLIILTTGQMVIVGMQKMVMEIMLTDSILQV